MPAAPHATLVHRIAGRARLRVPSQRGDAGYFERVERALRGCTLVRGVVGNPLTASVLFTHEGDFREIVRFAREHGLFDLAEPEPGTDSTLRQFYVQLGAIDARLKEGSAGQWGLSSVAFYALLGAGAYKIVRGDVLPAGITLLIQALSLVVRAGKVESAGPSVASSA